MFPLNTISQQRWNLEQHIARYQEYAADSYAAQRWLVDDYPRDAHALALARTNQRDAEMWARHARKQLDRLLELSNQV